MPNKIARSRLAVGLMSGTSMDGIDAALVRISGPPDRPHVQLLAFESCPYSDWLRDKLLAIASGNATTAQELSQINDFLGGAFADASLLVCLKAQVEPERLFVIGSHGQTLFHCGAGSATVFRRFRAYMERHGREVQSVASKLVRSMWRRNRIEVGFSLLSLPMMRKRFKANELLSLHPSTLQVAEPAEIAERAHVPVVSNFRTADMAAGGQGAPLVPMVDYLLLRDKKQGTVALNIGGIANLTVIPASAKPEEVIGFDTGPGNMVIDGLVRHFTKGRKSYDAGGRWAAQGKVLEPLINRMLNFPFFRQEPPKSAGREQFGSDFVGRYFLSQPGARREDLLRTAAELTAATVAGALERFVFPRTHVDRLIISGGGAHNRVLLASLQAFLPGLAIDLSDRYGLPVDAKEAIAFAVLADRTMHGLPGNLPRVTGARRAVVLGTLTRPGGQLLLPLPETSRGA